MRARAIGCGLALLLALAGPLEADDDPAAPTPETPAAAPASADAPPVATLPAPAAATRSGLDIYRNFREGLADPSCDAAENSRWRRHFAHAPGLLASPRDDVLQLFGYVVDRLREAHLPTEYALIPFVESGYRPGARSPQGPAGLWQFIAMTARNHKVPIKPGYDGRLSPVESTDAAVRYLKTLHGMFAGDWRLTVMAYNAGEYRLLSAIKRAGQRPATARPDQLPMPAITLSYVRKLHALSCIFEEVEDRDAWLQALDRPVPVLEAFDVPGRIGSLDALASRHGADSAQLHRLNPVFAEGRITRAAGIPKVLLPVGQAQGLAASERPWGKAWMVSGPEDISDAMADASADVDATPPEAPSRRHVVVKGDSIWRIARRYGLGAAQLLARNALSPDAVLRPGMVLAIDTVADGAAAGSVAE